MDLSAERLRVLEVVRDAGGSMGHDDERLAPFCDDSSTLSKPDVFNQCHDGEWLISRHDDRMDASTVYLTPKGWQALNSGRCR